MYNNSIETRTGEFLCRMNMNEELKMQGLSYKISPVSSIKSSYLEIEEKSSITPKVKNP